MVAGGGRGEDDRKQNTLAPLSPGIYPLLFSTYPLHSSLPPVVPLSGPFIYSYLYGCVITSAIVLPNIFYISVQCTYCITDIDLNAFMRRIITWYNEFKHWITVHNVIYGFKKIKSCLRAFFKCFFFFGFSLLISLQGQKQLTLFGNLPPSYSPINNAQW